MKAIPDMCDVPDALPGAPPDWQLAALLQPALIDVDGWLPVLARLWFDWSIAVIRAAIEHTLERPTHLAIVTDDASTRDVAFAMTFEHAAVSSTGLLTLDVNAARALIDALETDFASVRGAGPISDAEVGLLEYVALATIDRALAGAPASAQTLVIRGFHDAKAARALVDENRSPSIAIRLRISGREGIVRLCLPGLAGTPVSEPPAITAATDNSATVALSLALPPVRLPRADLRLLQPGDCLTIGATDLANFGVDCRIATRDGWTLATAAIVVDSPTVISARCGNFQLDTLSTAPPNDDQAILNLLIGEQRLTFEKLRDWQSGATIDFIKDPTQPVSVMEGLTCLARGELVKLDGEVSLRLIEVCSTDPAQHAATLPST